MKILFFLLSLALVAGSGDQADAQIEFSAPLLGTGHYERIDAGGSCANDPGFMAGQYQSLTQIQVGGNAFGCDSEWGAFAEFDFSEIGGGNQILSAVLILRYTGYGDDSSGNPYVGVFEYPYQGGPIPLLRSNLNEETVLAVFTPPGSTNIDIEIDVTNHLVELLDQEIFQTGFFVCGLFSEVGYDTLVFFGASEHQFQPRLIISTLEPVGAELHTMGFLKALYRQ